MLHRFPFRAMASPCELQLHGDDRDTVKQAARAATREVLRIERKYSRYRDDSVTAAINASAGRSGGIALDAETAALVDFAATAWEQSGGAFDITSGVLREAWNFRSGRVPTRAQIERARARVGWDRVRWQDGRLQLAPGQQIDFGGCGKEYAADRAAQLCREHGVEAGLVDLGGDIAIIGPHPDGSPWVVGVRDPRPSDGLAAVASIVLDRGGIATSGDYQRCMLVEGRRYAHILDPRTGWPVEGLTSVSVVAPRCLVAGAASTIAMLLGRRGGEWLDALGLPNLRVDAEGRVSGTLAGGDAGYGPGDGGLPDAKGRSAPSMRSPGALAMSISPGSTIT